MMAADVVLDWNEEALNAIRYSRTPPPAAARNLAIVHASIYDAVNAIDRSFAPYVVSVLANPMSSIEAAVSAAARTALSSLYPQRSAVFEAKHVSILASIPDGKTELDGVSLGDRVAQQMLAIRDNDGSANTTIYTPKSGPGKWQPTPPANAPALLPQWPEVKPFAMNHGSQFSPTNIPNLSSSEYSTAFNQVKELGSMNSILRTAEQTEIAKFWANGAGTSTPPGHLNQMAALVATKQGNTVLQNARLFAMLNIALADAAIMSWDAKYTTEFWRPITGIRLGESDGNPETSGDPTWTPLLVTPPFSSYTSGHASFSGAGVAVLRNFFGRDKIRFTLPSEDLSVGSRTFTSFSQAATESAVSRLYGGIHWSFDNDDGLRSGHLLGDFVYQNFLKRQANSPTAGVVGSDLIVVGDDRDNAITFERIGPNVVVRNAGLSLGSFSSSGFTNLIVDGRGGHDFILLGQNWLVASTILGGSGNDRIFGGLADDMIDAGMGRDMVFGLSGNDRIRGGAGDDFLYGGDGDDTINGDQGNDYLFGESGADSLFGNDGDDWLFGGLGDDLLDGGKGKNRLRR